MTDFHNLVIEPLNTTHDRPNFQCGADAPDRYLQKHARQDIKRRISRVFIATTPDNPKKVIGYYTLRSLSIELNQLPEKLSRELPTNLIQSSFVSKSYQKEPAQARDLMAGTEADPLFRVLPSLHQWSS